MGFRGEALASIAAVAQVELTTRLHGEEIGTRISISGSRFTGQEPVSCPEGSNFKIDNLFYNVPARRKFLKSNTTELNNILTAFERIVLINPQIHFTLFSNETEVFNLQAANMRQRIVDVFGKRFNQDILPVDVKTTMCNISGFVGKPESSRKKCAHQYFFVNGRYMKHPYFHKAVLNVYERLVPLSEQVPYFICFEVKPEDIDVNIHPTKTEIKFENEQAIWQILNAAVKDSLGKFNDVPSIDFDTLGKPDIPVYNPNTDDVKVPKTDVNPHYNPFSNASVQKPKPVAEQWEQLYAGTSKKMDEEPEIFESKQQNDSGDNPLSEKSPTHYQYKGRYIMTAVKSGLMIIDQHRAHVRILYEKYLDQLKRHTASSQRVLFPEVVHFSPSDEVMLKKIMPDMSEMGFELTDLGSGSYAVNGIPSGIEGLNVSTLITEMVNSVMENGTNIKDEFSHSLSLCLARNVAIPQGQILSNDEMENLVNNLFACSNVNYSPEGKSILCILRQQEIEHLLA
jgi:DNA mismatch repair protein MutL